MLFPNEGLRKGRRRLEEIEEVTILSDLTWDEIYECFFIHIAIKLIRDYDCIPMITEWYRYYVNAVAEDIGDSTYIESIKNDVQIPETERKAIVQSRVGQGLFRKALFQKYNGRCIITGVDHPKLLVASHIKPWAVSSNQERLSVDNGLLLSATYDRLFDSGLITFNKCGKIFLSSFIGEENVQRLHLSKNSVFNLNVNGNMGEYLDYHNDVLFVK